MPSITSQAVDARLTSAAIFLVVTLDAGAAAQNAVRGLCGDLSSLVRGVGFRASHGQLSCIVGIGSVAWDRLFGSPRPKELHPFREIQGVHHAPGTPGDLLFHIRAASMDLCFELATEILRRLGDAAAAADTVQGFKYFDNRDLLGFVDGTENPVAQAAVDATLIGDEDAAFAGGSYVIVQKYLHDMGKWNAIPVEQQEKIIGRKKLSDIELADAVHDEFRDLGQADRAAIHVLADAKLRGERGDLRIDLGQRTAVHETEAIDERRIGRHLLDEAVETVGDVRGADLRETLTGQDAVLKVVEGALQGLLLDRRLVHLARQHQIR